jgi:hypothetical protein
MALLSKRPPCEVSRTGTWETKTHQEFVQSAALYLCERRVTCDARPERGISPVQFNLSDLLEAYRLNIDGVLFFLYRKCNLR